MTPLNRRRWVTGAIAALLPARVAAARAQTFPPVSALEEQLPLHPGDVLPRLISWRGRLFKPSYIGAEAGTDGTYLVKLKLEPM